MSEPLQLESAPCPLGCAPADERVLVGRDRILNIPGEFDLVRCRTCGLMRTDPRPTPGTIGRYYPDSYGPYQGTRVAAEPAAARRTSWKSRLTSLYDSRAQALPPELAPGRMLEIGCASGSFLHRMAGKGWEVEGIEFSPTAGAAARALGYPVHIGSVEEAPEPSAPYDLLVGWMVLEHLHQPVHALRRLHRWGRPGASLVVSVPNVDSLEFRLFREHFYSLDMPRHLYHFTPRTLRATLARAGWRMTALHHQRSMADLIASGGNWLRSTGRSGSLVDRLAGYPQRRGRTEYYLYPLSRILSALGQTGRMTAWAERMDD